MPLHLFWCIHETMLPTLPYPIALFRSCSQHVHWDTQLVHLISYLQTLARGSSCRKEGTWPFPFLVALQRWSFSNSQHSLLPAPPLFRRPVAAQFTPREAAHTHQPEGQSSLQSGVDLPLTLGVPRDVPSFCLPPGTRWYFCLSLDKWMTFPALFRKDSLNALFIQGTAVILTNFSEHDNKGGVIFQVLGPQFWNTSTIYSVKGQLGSWMLARKHWFPADSNVLLHFSPFLKLAASERSKKMSMGCLNCVTVKFVLYGTSHCCPVLAFWVYLPCRLWVPRGQGLWLILVRLKISITLPWTPETDVKYMNNWINGLLTNKEVGSLRFMGRFDLLNIFKQPALSSQPIIGLTRVQGWEWMPVLDPSPGLCWLIGFRSRWRVKSAGGE